MPSARARPAIEERNHKLAVDIANQEMPLFADPTRIEQVIVNLLTNAAKYTPEGGDISVKAYPENEHVVIKVRDSGVGIPREMLTRVFELFMQVEPTLDRAQRRTWDRTNRRAAPHRNARWHGIRHERRSRQRK